MAPPKPPQPPHETAGRFLDAIGPQIDPQHVDVRLAAAAAAQHGVFNIEQLIALGLSKRAISHRKHAGRLYRIHRGVYSLTPPSLLSREGKLTAAVLACGPLAALSCQHAARAHGMLEYAPARPHVTVASRNGRERKSIVIHRSSTLEASDVVDVYGIPTTTVARTIFDLAGVLEQRPLERMLEQALHLDLLDMNQIRDQFERNRGRPRNRVAIERILARRRLGSTLTEGELEERFLAIVDRAGLPSPDTQANLDLDDGERMIRADFLWRQQRLIVETDDFGSHGLRSGFERDRRRDQRAAAAGYRTLRVTRLQVIDEPGRLQRTLEAMGVSIAA